MVFEAAAAPKSQAQFLEWYTAETEWVEGKRYDDPALSSPTLQAWLSEMFAAYPPMNGPSSRAEIPEDESSLADYSIAEQSVYVCFAWSKAAVAYEDVFRLASKHQLGFFNVSSESFEVWLPDGETLLLTNQDGSPSLKSRMQKLFSAFPKLP